MSRSLERIAQVAGSTALSRILGLVREILAARLLGAGALTSAFLTAFTVPNLFRRFLGEGALTGALVPVLTDRLRSGGKPAVFAATNEVLSWLGLASLAILLLAWLVCGGLWLLPAPEPRFQDAVLFTALLMPFLNLVCASAALAACLQVLGSFAAPALAQAWLNVAMIAALLLPGWLGDPSDRHRIWWLCGGVLLGGMLQLLTPALALARLGWRPAPALRLSEPVRAVLLLMGTSVLGAAIYQINLACSRFFAFDLNESAVAYLNFASRLMELPMGMFAIAVTTVIFPLMAARAGDGDRAGLTRALLQGVRLNCAVTFPAAVGLGVLAGPILSLLFEGGAFTASDTAACTPVLQIFAAALPFYALAALCTRAFHALKDMRTPVRAAVASLVANIILSLALPPLFGTPGLAAASNCAMLVQAIWLAAALRKSLPSLQWSALLGDWLKLGSAAAAMGIALAVIPDLRSLAASKLTLAAAVAAAIGAGAAVYTALVWILRIEDRERLLELVRQRLPLRLRGRSRS